MGEDKEKRVAILAAVFAYLSRRKHAQRPPTGRGAALKAWRLARSLGEDPVAGY